MYYNESSTRILQNLSDNSLIILKGIIFRIGCTVSWLPVGKAGEEWLRLRTLRKESGTWKEERFRRAYPGFEVNVLDAYGDSVHGNAYLRTVRETYLEEGEDQAKFGY